MLIILQSAIKNVSNTWKFTQTEPLTGGICPCILSRILCRPFLLPSSKSVLVHVLFSDSNKAGIPCHLDESSSLSGSFLFVLFQRLVRTWKPTWIQAIQYLVPGVHILVAHLEGTCQVSGGRRVLNSTHEWERGGERGGEGGERGREGRRP